MALVLLAALTLGALGAAAGAWQAREATATAVVLVEPLEGNPFSPGGQGEELVNLESEAQLVRSEAVATLVARGLDEPVAVDDLLAGVSVDVPTNTQILEISYDASSAAVAAERAQAFATQFLVYRQQRVDSLVEGQRVRVLARIEAETRRLTSLVASLEEAQTSGERTLLRGRVDAQTAQIAELRRQLAELSFGPTDPGQVVTPATAGVELGSRLVLLGGVGGLLLGLLGGAALILARGWLAGGGLRHPDEVTALGLPVAARLPGRDLDPQTEGESVRLLRSAVLARLTPGAPGTSIVVSRLATVPGELPAELARALAHATARSAVSTVLVDLAEPEGSATVRSPGLLAVLRGRADLDCALERESEHLEVLRVGSGDGLVEDLVVAPAMRRLLGDCAARAELVLVSAPALDTSSGRGLVEMVDALVAEVRPTDRPEHVEAAVALVGLAGVGWSRAAWVDPPLGEAPAAEPRPLATATTDP